MCVCVCVYVCVCVCVCVCNTVIFVATKNCVYLSNFCDYRYVVADGKDGYFLRKLQCISLPFDEVVIWILEYKVE